MKVSGDRSYTARLPEPGKTHGLERNFHATPIVLGEDISEEDVFYEVLDRTHTVYREGSRRSVEYIVYGVPEDSTEPGTEASFRELSPEGMAFVRDALSGDADELFFRFNGARY